MTFKQWMEMSDEQKAIVLNSLQEHFLGLEPCEEWAETKALIEKLQPETKH